MGYAEPHNRLYSWGYTMISELAREMLSRSMADTDGEPVVSFSDHKGDSCVTRVFRGVDAVACAQEWLELALQECCSIGEEMHVYMLPFMSAPRTGWNVVAVVTAYDLVCKSEMA